MWISICELADITRHWKLSQYQQGRPLRMCDSPFIVKLYETYNSSSAQEKNGRPVDRSTISSRCFLQPSKWTRYPPHLGTVYPPVMSR